jgi:hypothetical protein
VGRRGTAVPTWGDGEALPGDGAVFVEEGGGGAVLREGGEADGDLGALGGGAGAAVAVEVGGAVAGVGGVDFDGAWEQFLGEGDSEAVEGGFGGAVGESVEGGEVPVGVASLREGAKAAGDVDDASGGGFLEEREESLDDVEGAEEVGFVDAAKHFEIEFAGRDGFVLSGGVLAAFGVDAGVVDEDVEALGGFFDVADGGLDGGEVGDFEGKAIDVEAGGFEFGGGLPDTLGIASGHPDGDAGFGELAADFEADAFVGAGDEGDGLGDELAVGGDVHGPKVDPVGAGSNLWFRSHVPRDGEVREGSFGNEESGDLDGDGGFYRGVGIVAFKGDVGVGEVGEVAELGVEDEAGGRAGFAAELFAGLVEVVFVQMEIAEGVDEIAGAEVADLGDHAGEEGVGGEVEGDAEEEVGAALVELAAEFAVEDEELKEGVAGREGHGFDFGGVPGGDDVAAAVGLGADLGEDAGDLVDGAAVGRAPVAPLGAVDAAEIAVGVGPFVPDADAVFLEPADIGFAAEEPEELVDDRFEVDLFGGEEREAVAEGKAGLRAEEGERAGAGAVGLGAALIQDEAEEIQVGGLAHGRVKPAEGKGPSAGSGGQDLRSGGR